MSVSKDPYTGTWTVQYYEKDFKGKQRHRKKRGFRTKKEAREWEFTARKMVPIAELTVKQFVPIYFENKKYELKQSSINNKMHMINKHILPYFGDKTLGSITPADVINWQNTLIEMGYEPTYLRMIQNQLTALYTVNVNIRMLKKWKIKMYVFLELLFRLCFHKGPFFLQTV